MDKSFLYVIGAHSGGPIKIGFSKHPEKRLAQLQTGNSDKMLLHFKKEFDTTMVKPIEKLIHKSLSYNKVSGEWFDISPEDAILELEHAFIKYEDVSPNVLRNTR